VPEQCAATGGSNRKARVKQRGRAVAEGTKRDAVSVERKGHVAVVEMQRPPHNYVDPVVLGQVADTLEELAADDTCRAVVLAAGGRSFCAGANFSAAAGSSSDEAAAAGGFSGGARSFYDEAIRVFEAEIPLVAAVHGGAIGGGMGFALAADLRVTCPEAYFWANFVRLGIHQGFAMSVTVPALVGESMAADLLLTGRRVYGEEALTMGLANRCVPREEVREASILLAEEIAAAAPLAVSAVRRTLRDGLGERVRAALDHELTEQAKLMGTQDAGEGIRASFEKRAPEFLGK